LIAAVMLGIAGLFLRDAMERAMKAQISDDLGALHAADVEAVKLYFHAHEALATIAVSDPRNRALAAELAETRDADDSARLLRSPRLTEIRDALRPWMQRYEYNGFSVFNRQGVVVASHHDEVVGQRYPRDELGFALDKAMAGKATVARPLPSEAALVDIDGKKRMGIPTMYAMAPIRAADDRVVGVLGFRMRPEQTFTHVLNVAKFGASGETLAFDRNGRLLSQSRFDDDLKRIGLIADQPHVRSTLNLELRDPKVDMIAGARPKVRRQDQPLIHMAADAIQGHSGVDVDGYRDYRGVFVVGAWGWLPEYDFGIGTEVDRAQAYRTLTILRIGFWTMFALLGASAVMMFIFTVVLTRLRRSAQRAALEAKQLGRYTLDEMIGEGGMGVVYRARHAMLRRPTAVKLLQVEKSSEAAIARFEREVQLTSQLCHPNTITIFDYGRTPEGIFYYAMEFLDGISLQTLIDRYGPQPEGRVLFILRQICGSLAEAHSVGLIHRDIKPANIILNHRGGAGDMVKLLDFGLAKAAESDQEGGITATGTITGTPLYMAPEAISGGAPVDARSDLYSVGAVGYALLTGRPVFDSQNVSEILYKQVHSDPEPPSARLGKPVSPDLESIILRCLAKNPADRPQSARVLALELAACDSAASWTEPDAEEWWQTQLPRPSAELSKSTVGQSAIADYGATALWEAKE
jgi:hypothetical protein